MVVTLKAAFSDIRTQEKDYKTFHQHPLSCLHYHNTTVRATVWMGESAVA